MPRRLLQLSAAHEAARTSPDDDLWSRDPKKFGFRWFLPELLKHKTIWRDVLIASLVLQLVGLTTPLFTQVIIDKVVVHQTQSTLTAIGVGLVIFLFFNAFLTWLRQYFILHTGNRIDAVLGSQVFRHLVRLHLRYFEQRPTGTLIARMQGVETVRQFISGAAVTLFLDLPFLFVFLAVMFWYSWQLQRKSPVSLQRPQSHPETRPPHRHHRPLRLRQKHARQTAARLLPGGGWPHRHRRARYPPPVGQRAATVLRRGAAGDHPLCQHRLRKLEHGQPARQLR